ncbi:MAG: Ultraviolet N-glycosylase/AP lyase [Deltaproteobacteria bacterium ADurb.Bin510]|nr:MAG: Ultraviolet N-glycosylase/AP lyase [Deltaproteobacteria bacterium ADurb.Bin510]
MSEDEISELIFPVGFFRQKAKHLVALPRVINELFSGQIPAEIDELCMLPGVGRKTANLVRALAFHQPAICVDTHVHRINNRLGYVTTKTPLETELALRQKLPVEYWLRYNAVFVSFGQHTCRPVKPRCAACPLSGYCASAGFAR